MQNNLNSINLSTMLSGPSRISTQLALVDLCREGTRLDGAQGTLAVDFGVTHEKDGQYVLRFQLTGKIVLKCCRCCEDFTHHLSSTTSLLLLAQAPAEMGQDLDYEPIILSKGTFDLLAIITDELLLSLPLGHDGNCSQALIDRYADNCSADIAPDNPFTVLASVK